MRFDNTTYAVNEDVGIIQPLLLISNPSSFNETVQVINADISTNGKVNFIYVCRQMIIVDTGGIDYDSGPYNVIFPAGSTNTSFDIMINDDGVLEDDETFLVSIKSIINGHHIGDPSTAGVTIIDTTGTQDKLLYTYICKYVYVCML